MISWPLCMLYQSFQDLKIVLFQDASQIRVRAIHACGLIDGQRLQAKKLDREIMRSSCFRRRSGGVG